MTGEPNGAAPDATPPAGSGRVVIAFSPDQPTDPAVSITGVTHGQLYLAAYLIDLIAHEVRTATLVAAASGVAGIPRAAGSDDIDRIARDIMARRPA